MRRLVGYGPYMFAVAAVLLAGCSDSSSSPVADTTEARAVGDARSDDDLPAATVPVHAATDEMVGDVAPKADTPSADTASEKDPPPAEIAAGADSDTPGLYQQRAAEQADKPTHEHAHGSSEKVGDDKTPKRNGRRPDGDDPAAPLIVPEVALKQPDVPLNDGREPSAKPIPEGQRVAVEPKDVAPQSLSDGRAKGAKPGAELIVADPAKAKPATNPVTPSQAKLADLSESVQALDKDGDGQLGVYEWPREKLAEFKTLDSNQDGFLTPTELVAGRKTATDAAQPKTDKASTEDAKEKDNDEPKVEPKVEAKEKEKEKTATQPAAETPPQENATTPAAETADKATTPATSTDGAAKKDDSSVEDKPTQGS